MLIKRFVDVYRFNVRSMLFCMVLLVLILVTLLGLGLFFDGYYEKIMSVPFYLGWHTIIEFVIIIISFSVFMLCYYTYDQTYNLRSIFTGSVFLTFGLIEAFHTLCTEGMPAIFVNNEDSNRAILLWVIMVLIESLGFVIISFIPVNKKTKLSKNIFVLPSLLICAVTFISVIYYYDIFPVMYVEGKGLTDIKIYLEYFVIFLFIVSFIRSLYVYLKSKNTLLMLFMFALIICIFSEVAFTQYFSIYDFYYFFGHFLRIVAFFIIFRISFIFSVQEPYYELNRAKDEIKHYADNLDVLVENRTNELKKMNQKLMEDLEYAKGIQMAMLPSQLPDGPEVSFCAKYFPAEQVGGDYYNVFKIDEHNVAICIGDVSGHGVSAAMLTVFLNQSIKTVRETGGNKVEILKPSEVLKSIYDSFNKTNFNEEIYIVFFYAVFNLNSRELVYSSAGLNAAPVVIKDGKITEVEMIGFPICKIDEIYKVSYVDLSIKLSEGDKILFYTDGLIDTKNSRKEPYSSGKLFNVLLSNQDKSCSDISNALEKDIFEFKGDYPLEDDITFLLMHIK